MTRHTFAYLPLNRLVFTRVGVHDQLGDESGLCVMCVKFLSCMV